jgi:hypothetical protein
LEQQYRRIVHRVVFSLIEAVSRKIVAKVVHQVLAEELKEDRRAGKPIAGQVSSKKRIYFHDTARTRTGSMVDRDPIDECFGSLRLY